MSTDCVPLGCSFGKQVLEGGSHCPRSLVIPVEAWSGVSTLDAGQPPLATDAWRASSRTAEGLCVAQAGLVPAGNPSTPAQA